MCCFFHWWKKKNWTNLLLCPSKWNVCEQSSASRWCENVVTYPSVLYEKGEWKLLRIKKLTPTMEMKKTTKCIYFVKLRTFHARWALFSWEEHFQSTKYEIERSDAGTHTCFQLIFINKPNWNMPSHENQPEWAFSFFYSWNFHEKTLSIVCRFLNESNSVASSVILSYAHE